MHVVRWYFDHVQDDYAEKKYFLLYNTHKILYYVSCGGDGMIPKMDKKSYIYIYPFLYYFNIGKCLFKWVFFYIMPVVAYTFLSFCVTAGTKKKCKSPIFISLGIKIFHFDLYICIWDLLPTGLLDFIIYSCLVCVCVYKC